MATVLRGAQVYDGTGFTGPVDISIDGDRIVGATPAGGDVVDVTGGYLIPGLIDCHVHLRGPETLTALVSHGVTTALDMGSPAPLIAGLRGLPGVSDIRSSLMVATSPASAHAQRMHAAPDVHDALVSGDTDVDAWVAAHIDQGADYIKIVIDLPGFAPETVAALVAAAHARGYTTIAHASRSDAVDMAQQAGVDVLTHVPLDQSIGAAQAAELAATKAVVVPTLTMMSATARNLRAAGLSQMSYESARASVAALHTAGVPILAGTDANATPGAPASPPFGSSLHDELELLVDAGLTPREAIEAATSAGALQFDLADRGRIAPGLRADLVLLDEDPLADIAAIRSIRAIWCGGVRVA